MHQTSSQRVIGADTIRALATLWVFAGHLFLLEPTLKAIDSPWTRLLRPGYMGVAAFFVLSGFLLSMPFWRAFAAGADAPNLKHYFRQRLSRIVPEFYVCVLVMALITGAFSTRWGLIQVAGCLTFTNSLLPPTYMPIWNAPLWSIGIEMLFYLFLPIVALGIFRSRSRIGARIYLASLTCLVAAGQLLLLRAAPQLERAIGNESLFSAGSSSTIKNAVVLFAHFLIGMIAADIYLSQPIRSTNKRFNIYDLLVFAATSVIGISLLSQTKLPSLTYMHYQWPTFPVLIGLLLVCLPHSATCGRWVEGRFMKTTATLSYGFYIWHIPILYGLKHVWPSSSDGRITYFPTYVLVALICTYSTALVSYCLIGRPAMDRMRRGSVSPKPHSESASSLHKIAAIFGRSIVRPSTVSTPDKTLPFTVHPYPITASFVPHNTTHPHKRYNRYLINHDIETHHGSRSSGPTRMPQADTHEFRISPQTLAADAYEADSSTDVIEDSLDVIEELDAYNRWVFELLSPHVAGRVLEVGCGTGNITQFLASRADEVVGIDPVARFVDKFRLRFAGNQAVTSHRCTLADLTPASDDSGCFDTAVSCNVFEHIENHVAALGQVARHLKPGGKAVIFVPAGPVAFGKLDRELGHYRRYTVGSLRQAMQDAGLEWVEGRYSNMVGLFGWWLNSVLLGKTTVPGKQAIWFNKLVPFLSRIERFIPTPFGQSVVGVARKPLSAAQPAQLPMEYRRAA